MKVRHWMKQSVGAMALASVLVAGACGSDGNRPADELYQTGTWRYGSEKPHRAAAPAPAKVNEPAPAAESKPAPKPAPTRTSGPCSPQVGPDQTVSSQAFPTGELSSSAIVVYTIMPKEVRRNQPYEYQLQVCNLTSGELQNVVVLHENQNNLEIVSSKPPASRGADGTPQWILGSLGPNDSEIITVTGRAGQTGVSSNCVSVVYNNYLCAETKVVEPALALKKTATPEVLLCDPITLTYTVTNTGTGACDTVVVKDNLPNGLTTMDGKTLVSFNAGTLAAGQSKEFKVQAKAARTGSYSSPAVATSGCGSDANAAAVSTVVRQPKLAIKAACREYVYLGRNVTFDWTLTNSGDAACDNTTISAPVPAGSTFVSASNGGVLQGNTVVWNAGTVTASGGKRDISMTVKPNGIGTLRAAATAECECAEQVADGCETDVRGIPAILLEVVDNPDPIAVGDSVTYTITVTNQGSAPGTGIKVVCTLPEQEDFVNAGGATNATRNGATITFAPLPTLAPGASATFKVTAKANGAGDVRFKTVMTSDQFQRPVEETESTNLYQ